MHCRAVQCDDDDDEDGGDGGGDYDNDDNDGKNPCFPPNFCFDKEF